MKKPSRWLFICALMSADVCLGMGDDDPFLATLKMDKLETAVAESDTPVRVEAKAWAGYDLNKLYLKSDIEIEDGETLAADLEVLYGRAISPFWDMQVGWRHDFKPTPERDWFAIGVQGLAPYFFEIDSALYLSGSGRSAFELSAEYELLFTQKLILSPEIEAVVNGYNDEPTGAGSGLSSLELGLRLRYEVRREFAPYVGIHWESLYGNTASFARANGDDRSELTFVVGLRAWF